MTRRSYTGAAVATSLTTGIVSTTLSLVIGDATGWPTGSGGKFYIVIDRGLAAEEKVLVTSRAATTLTVASTGDRGADGTTAHTHSTGATVEHCLASPDVDEPNAFINTPGVVGDITTSNPADTAAAGGSGRWADAAHKHARETSPQSIPTFSLKNSTTTNVLSGSSDTALAMNQENVDTHNGHNLVTNNSRYTIPAGWAGTWYVAGWIQFVANSAGSRYIRIHLNGAGPTNNTINNSRVGIAADVADLSAGGLLTGLVAGDYIELAASQNSGSTLATVGMLSGFWVHA